jgi:hypothetical protein
MKNISLIFIIGLFITLSWCTKITITNSLEQPETIQETTTQEIEIEIDMTDKNQVIDNTLTALKNWDMDKLEKLTSELWIRFSPYSYVDTDRHIVLKKEELKEAFDSETQYARWSEDGSGFPILMTFKEYIERYIYDIDFQQWSEITYDKIVQRGNTINNIDDIYTGASTVEFYIPWINPEYEWMDRRGLTLVLQQENNERKIKAIVHSQRTI